MMQKKEKHSVWTYIVGIAVFVIVGSIARATVGSFNDSNNDNTSRAREYFDSSNNEEWRTFNSTKGQFTVDLPTYPSEETDLMDLGDGYYAKYTLYTSEASEGFYGVGYIDYEDFPLADSDTSLNGMVNGMVANVGGELVSSQYVSHEGYPAVDFEDRSRADGISLTFEGRGILVDNKGYIILVVVEEGIEPQTDLMVKSFKFL